MYKKENSFGILYIVPTPIGNLLDISYRAINILKKVNIIASESITHTGILFKKFSISNKFISLNKINEKKNTEICIKILKSGKNIAIVSKAGTPLINDPGILLVKKSHKEKIRVVPIPGACAAITALSASGLNTKNFCYEGFLPKKKILMNKKINNLKNEKKTTIFYESPKRIIKTIEYIFITLQPKRMITLAKEITKTWEFIYTGTIESFKILIKEHKILTKGEIVLLIEGIKNQEKLTINKKILKTFKLLLKNNSKSSAIKITSQIYGIKKNFLYNTIIKNFFEAD